MRSIFNKEQINFIKDNYKDISYSEIANHLGFTERQIRGKVSNMGLKKNRQFNKRYFKSINTPNQAYWLGFIYADGYLLYKPESRSHELGIELKDDDVQTLINFNKELGGVHKIQKRQRTKTFNGYEYTTNTCLIRIYSKDIVEDLINLQVFPNKTYVEDHPKCDEFFWSFLRGYIDGDGCISINDRNYIRLHMVSANTDFFKYLKDKINDLLNIEGSIYKENDRKYQLCYFRQADIKTILDKIYENKNCTKMIRKYNIYKSYYGSPI